MYLLAGAKYQIFLARAVDIVMTSRVQTFRVSIHALHSLVRTASFILGDTGFTCDTLKCHTGQQHCRKKNILDHSSLHYHPLEEIILCDREWRTQNLVKGCHRKYRQ